MKLKSDADSLSVALIAVLFAVFIYSPSFVGPFLFDDYQTIIENTAIKALKNIGWIWYYDPSRFLTHFSFAINYAFHGLNVEGYHAVNFLLHLFNTFLVYSFVKLILGLDKAPLHRQNPIALAASFIFLSHPIQTSAVTYISQRSVLLAAFFYLLVLNCYFLYRREGSRKYYALALIGAAAGIFTKPIIITLPLAIILCEIYFFENPFKAAFRKQLRLLPFLVILLVVPVLLALWKYKTLEPGQIIEMTRETTDISRKEYLLTQFNVLVTYLRLLVWPVHQNLDYDYPVAKGFFQFPTYCSFGALAVIGWLAFFLFRRKKMISFGIGFFLIALSLESSIFPISDVIFEHRLYLPLIGFAVALSVFLNDFLNQKSRIIGMSTLVVVLGVLTYQRNEVWSDRVGFLSDIVKKSPNKARPHNNLAVAYQEYGDLENAKKEYLKAISLKNDYAHAYNNLANIYVQEGKIREAREYFEKAIQSKAGYEAPYFNLANIYKNENQFQKAEEYYKKSLSVNKVFIPAYVGLGQLYMEQGKTDLAGFYLRQATKLNPDYPYSYYSLGDMALKEKDFENAVQFYRKAAEKKPDMTAAYNNIANILDMKGEWEEAAENYQIAIGLDPRFTNAYFNLAHTLKKLGRIEEARRNLFFALKAYKEAGNTRMIKASEERLRELDRSLKTSERF